MSQLHGAGSGVDTGIEPGLSQESDPSQGLADKIAFLRRPESYPEPTTRVDVVEAHMSCVFLTDRHAYKLKKPYQRNGIDYGTPAMRHLNCKRELRLNRRLATGVYLDLVPLTGEPVGRLAIGGAGPRLDWLVRMRRLPAALTLEHGLEAGTIGAAEARRIIDRLAPFFATAPRARIGPASFRRRLSKAIADTSAELRRPEFGLDPPEIDTLAAMLSQYVGGHGELLEARVRAGHIVEGHGDLRPEHIYLTEPVTVIDCIEFDRNLRLRDPIDELAFLAMECDRAGAPELDGWLFGAYRDVTGDAPPRPLVDFYKAHNAFTRAKIAIWHLDDPDTGPRAPWIARAEDYLRHARRYLAPRERSPPA